MLTVCYIIAGDVMAGKSCNDLEEPETSSVTVKNGCSEAGGYDCDFVESPADDLLCKICHLPARDPQQTNVCCGQIFCAVCLGKYMDSTILDNKQCPYCKTEPFTFMPDARTKRYIWSLKVFCFHKSLGCTWTGELRSLEQHLVKNLDNKKGCPFTELQCSNGCGVVMQRRLVEGHLKSDCKLREVNCIYCKITGIYQWISGDHQEECPKYPVECPNHCEVGHVRREEISRHLEECPLAIVECPYAAVGCESVVRRKEEMEHVMRSVEQHMEYNKNAILANQTAFQKRLDVKEQEMENVKQDLQLTKDKLIAREQELEDIKGHFQVTGDRQEQAIMRITKDLRNFIDRLDAKDKEVQGTRRDLKATRDRLNAKERAMMSINKDLQDTKDKLEQSEKIQYQLKTAITEKGRELDEVRKNAEENNKTLLKMIQQLKDKLEGTEQSLQHQLKVDTQLQLQIEEIFNLNWSSKLNYLANSGNEIVPVVIKLSEFEKYKYREYIDLPRFYTKDGGYKMFVSIYPKGSYGFDDNISVGVHLMKGDHDDHLAWPVKGILTVQLLNQLSDSKHGEPVEFHFYGSGRECQRVITGTKSSYGVLLHQFMPHKRLSYDADKKCQYLKDDCVIFRVCSFQ